MPLSDPNSSSVVARRLHLLGDWDLAVTVLEGQSDTQAAEQRAEILFDKFFWRLDSIEPAANAVSQLDDRSVWFAYLTARLAYTRLSFFEPLPDDYATAEKGYRVVAADPLPRGWGEFHWAVLIDNIDEDRLTAAPHYDKAYEISRQAGDLLLESYVIRHQAGHALADGDRTEGMRQLRRSLHLRASRGMRPQIAAAQLAVARELPADDSERTTLVEASRSVADELGLAWVREGLDEL